MDFASVAPTSSEWSKWLADAERRLRQVYLLSPERLIAEYRREGEITRGYHGREILELLQNAGDAARISGVRGKVRLVITPHGLVIGNTGHPFEKEGVTSLQIANLSPKRQREAVVIGDKGLGFRSILNWTQSPLISSGELGLAFLPNYASNVLCEMEKDSDKLAKMVAEQKAIAGRLIVPRLAFPQWVPDWSKHDWPETDGISEIASVCQSLRNDNYDTAVGMPFSTTRAYQEVVQQVDELRPEFLLLVDSIDLLEIQIQGQPSKIWQCIPTNDKSIIRTGDTTQSSWIISNYEGDVPHELLDNDNHNINKFKIILAISDTKDNNPGYLFNYFPTDVEIPLPLLVHTTVELDDTRKHVNDTPANRYILGKVAEQIAELAEQQLETGKANAWDGCRLITPSGNWGNDLKKFGVPSILKEAAKKKQLIPVLGGGYRNAFHAKLPPGENSCYWLDWMFPEMAVIEDKAHLVFARHLDVSKFFVAEILDRLLAAQTLTPEERALAITGLVESKEKLTDNNLNCLLCDEEEKPIPAGINAILQPTGELPALPHWAAIRFLHAELRQWLADFLPVSDSRELQNLLRPFGVVEYSLSALIRPVLAEGNRQARNRPDEEFTIRQETLQFLWEVHQSVGSDTSFPTDATLKLLDQNNGWTDPEHLYLGEGYGNEGNVIQDIYGPWAKHKLVASINLPNSDTSASPEQFAQFLQWLGVARWPGEIELSEVDAEYLNAVRASLRYPVSFGDCRFDSPNDLPQLSITGATSIDGLEDILQNASSEAVLAWLALDPRASSWVHMSQGRGTLSIYPRYKQNKRHYRDELPSYIHWRIATSAWLPANDGHKQAPRRCLLGDRQLEALFPSPQKPNQILIDRYGVSDRLHASFRNAGVMPGLSQIARDELYRLLLEIPDLSPDGKPSRALCRWFISNENFVLGSAGPYQERFFQEGRIWGSKERTSDYFPIADLRHIDQEGFPPALTDKLPIADLPKRIGAQKVKDVLGVKPLDRSEIHQELYSHRTSPRKDDLAEWFNAAKPYIKRLRHTQVKQKQTVLAFERLNLIVCDELSVQMQYKELSYYHSALEGEWFVFSDHLYVRGDLEDSLDLLADSVGTAVASVFNMADGDAFVTCPALFRPVET
ncbi:hypothetical protein SAMN05421830_1251 [Desulfomicrobium norvegicum]|uniref:Uncharacterized protein n=1 Tax=Desulfomicrobium norvegicum (strain DSM 1741 / NCIMB 8310) TaxID=52561 RepID=A0A8G2C6B5_DESNO|nr:hypothetical protein [Desulfomicrobium norvegicum]SFM23769.1 hypothetical protein SAMN05421830_1251 [Desulfomicrobium norvegicum]